MTIGCIIILFRNRYRIYSMIPSANFLLWISPQQYRPETVFFSKSGLWFHLDKMYPVFIVADRTFFFSTMASSFSSVGRLCRTDLGCAFIINSGGWKRISHIMRGKAKFLVSGSLIHSYSTFLHGNRNLNSTEHWK